MDLWLNPLPVGGSLLLLLEFVGGQVAQAGVRPYGVVVLVPALDEHRRFAPAAEPFQRQALVAELALTPACSLPREDARYLGQLVSQRTGLPQSEAEKRVMDTFTRMQTQTAAATVEARAMADKARKARKASAVASLWFFVSLLVGAFVASFLATLGGRHRDQF